MPPTRAFYGGRRVRCARLRSPASRHPAGDAVRCRPRSPQMDFRPRDRGAVAASGRRPAPLKREIRPDHHRNAPRRQGGDQDCGRADPEPRPDERQKATDHGEHDYSDHLDSPFAGLQGANVNRPASATPSDRHADRDRQAGTRAPGSCARRGANDRPMPATQPGRAPTGPWRTREVARREDARWLCDQAVGVNRGPSRTTGTSGFVDRSSGCEATTSRKNPDVITLSGGLARPQLNIARPSGTDKDVFVRRHPLTTLPYAFASTGPHLR